MPITIGIPFHNAEAYLPDAIRSIFTQTYQDWELILVDDGSTDRSLDIARSVTDPRVRVISDGENKKLSYRLNQIAAEASFDLIGRMDADDLISPSRFEKQVSALEADAEVDLVTTGICSLSNDSRPVGVRSGFGEVINGRNLLLGRTGIVHAAILGKKSWFLRNPYDEKRKRAQDYELWLRSFSKGDLRIRILDDPLYYYREEENASVPRLLAAYAIQREMYRRYGHLGFASYEIPLRTGISYLKGLVVKGLSALDRMDLLLARRNDMIEDADLLKRFNGEIAQILQTKVPGLDN